MPLGILQRTACSSCFIGLGSAAVLTCFSAVVELVALVLMWISACWRSVQLLLPPSRRSPPAETTGKNPWSTSVLEFSVGAFLSRMCCPCTLTVNSMFAEYAFAFPHSRNRSLVKTSKPHTPYRSGKPSRQSLHSRVCGERKG